MKKLILIFTAFTVAGIILIGTEEIVRTLIVAGLTACFVRAVVD